MDESIQANENSEIEKLQKLLDAKRGSLPSADPPSGQAVQRRTQDTQILTDTQETPRNSTHAAAAAEKLPEQPPGPSGSSRSTCPTANQSIRQQREAAAARGFGPFVSFAYARSERDYHKPQNAKRHITRLFHFTRYMSYYRDDPKRTAKSVFNGVDTVLGDWTKEHFRSKGQQVPRGTDPWQVWFDVSRDEAEIEFVAVWDRVRFTPGDDPLACAARKAQEHPLGLHQSVAAKRPAAYPKFISLACWLQVILGNQRIMLPCREVAEVLKLGRTAVSHLIQMAIEDNYLKCEVRGEFRSAPGKGKAAEYRVNIGFWPILVQTSQRGTVAGYEQAAVLPPSIALADNNDWKHTDHVWNAADGQQKAKP